MPAGRAAAAGIRRGARCRTRLSRLRTLNFMRISGRPAIGRPARRAECRPPPGCTGGASPSRRIDAATPKNRNPRVKMSNENYRSFYFKDAK
ncbi:hypothetical protein [Burkholderia oklahomensis]|uniref:hypothetical protein n=1 Tax=Burkholderia oklahomensis TaxID=342113 RepID=UPI000B1D4F46|nr:hypothetical protein [Burkholderia oklahomensis]MBI0358793.1 hypothetical protein [Burkholderia oklahomensis]